MIGSKSKNGKLGWRRLFSVREYTTSNLCIKYVQQITICWNNLAEWGIFKLQDEGWIFFVGHKARDLQVYQILHGYLPRTLPGFVFLRFEDLFLVGHFQSSLPFWSWHRLNWWIRLIKIKLAWTSEKQNPTRRIDDKNFTTTNDEATGHS